jgi:hypothetical protein
MQFEEKIQLLFRRVWNSFVERASTFLSPSILPKYVINKSSRAPFFRMSKFAHFSSQQVVDLEILCNKS